MPQKTTPQLNSANAALFVNDGTPKIRAASEKAYNQDVNDSSVNILSDIGKGLTNSPNPITEANPVASQADLAGGLPTGETPSAYAQKTSSFNVVSATFADIPEMSITVTTESTVPIFGLFSYGSTQTGSGSQVMGEITILVNGVGPTVPMPVDYANGDNKSGTIEFRSAPLPAGTYTIKAQARKISGARDMTITAGYIFAQGQQGPIGPTGPGVPTGGTENQVVTKKSGTDFDTEFRMPLLSPFNGVPGASQNVAAGYLVGKSRVIDFNTQIEHLYVSGVTTAIWQSQSGTWTPTATPSAEISDIAAPIGIFSINGNVCSYTIFCLCNFIGNGSFGNENPYINFTPPVVSSYSSRENAIGVVNVGAPYTQKTLFTESGVLAYNDSGNIAIQALFITENTFSGILGGIGLSVSGQYIIQ